MNLDAKQIKQILEDEIFVNYSPEDRTEITYIDMAEILEDLQNIMQGKHFYIAMRKETVEFLGLLEKLGVLNEEQRRYLCRLNISIPDSLTGKEEKTSLNQYIFTDDLESMYANIQDSTFCSNYFPIEAKLYLGCPFELELIDPKDVIGTHKAS